MAREPSEFLTPAEVKQLAGGAANLAEQLRVLDGEGIPCKLVGKRIVVSRYHAREWLAGRHVMPPRGPKLELVK